MASNKCLRLMLLVVVLLETSACFTPAMAACSNNRKSSPGHRRAGACEDRDRDRISDALTDELHRISSSSEAPDRGDASSSSSSQHRDLDDDGTAIIMPEDESILIDDPVQVRDPRYHREDFMSDEGFILDLMQNDPLYEPGEELAMNHIHPHTYVTTRLSGASSPLLASS